VETTKLDEYVKKIEIDRDLRVIEEWVVPSWLCYSKIPDNLKAY